MLQPVAEDWTRALAIVAHPDDLEFGSAAAIARWTRQGKQISYVLVTSGEAGIDGMVPDETRRVREEEQRTAAAIVGVQVVEFLGHPDGIIEYGVPLRRDLAATIRRHRPEIVITNNFRDTWDGAVALNQPDHVATGRGTLDAARDAANRWIFPDRGEQWTGVREVWAAGSPDAQHGVDITETFDAGVESLLAHDAYLRGLGNGDFDAEEFLESISRPHGAQLGCRHGAVFEVFPLHRF
jgi:LmbE family N-acetylglucosaminyl deacetylase